MSDSVYKTIEITGTSPSSIDDAVRGAVTKAAETVRHLDWFEVTQVRGHITEAQIEHVQVTLKIGFRLD